MTGVLTATPILFDEIPIRVDRDEVLRFQGYKKGRDLPTPDVRRLYETALEEAERLMAPRAVYRAIPVATVEPDALKLADGTRVLIPAIGRLWGEIEELGIAICTVGDTVEERARGLFAEREFPLAVMLDSVGSAAVESLAEWLNDRLCQLALPHFKVTNRVSPGYAGWKVEDQALIFRLCPGAEVGVRLNEACVMTPAKSITFAVGIGPRARVDHYFTQCRRCWMRDCAYRRAPADKDHLVAKA